MASWLALPPWNSSCRGLPQTAPHPQARSAHLSVFMLHDQPLLLGSDLSILAYFATTPICIENHHPRQPLCYSPGQRTCPYCFKWDAHACMCFSFWYGQFNTVFARTFWNSQSSAPQVTPHLQMSCYLRVLSLAYVLCNILLLLCLSVLCAVCILYGHEYTNCAKVSWDSTSCAHGSLLLQA